jgi:hypothetical protein
VPENYYEKIARETIERILQANKGKETKQIVRALKDSYPFGEKKGRPYKTWNRVLEKYFV